MLKAVLFQRPERLTGVLKAVWFLNKKKTEISGILCVSTTPFQTHMKKFDDFLSKLNTINNKAVVEEIIKMLPEYKRLS